MLPLLKQMARLALTIMRPLKTQLSTCKYASFCSICSSHTIPAFLFLAQLLLFHLSVLEYRAPLYESGEIKGRYSLTAATACGEYSGHSKFQLL